MVDDYVNDNSDKLFSQYEQSNKSEDPRFHKMVETIQNVTNSTSKLDMVVSLPQNNGAHTI